MIVLLLSLVLAHHPGPPPKRAHPARTVKVWICPLPPPGSHAGIDPKSCFVVGYRRW